MATFEDVRTRWGVAQPTAAFTGFGTDWIDYDNDGWLDLFMTNGAVNIVESQRGQPAPFRMKNLLFHNTLGRAAEFAGAAQREAGAERPGVRGAIRLGRGAAFGDVDNDGDIDIVVTNNGGPVRLLINEAAAGAHWLQLRLEQPGGNRRAMGAFVGVERAGRPTAVAAGEDRRQLCLGERQPDSRRSRRHRGGRRGGRPLARRTARALDGSPGRSPGDAAAGDGNQAAAGGRLGH